MWTIYWIYILFSENIHFKYVELVLSFIFAAGDSHVRACHGVMAISPWTVKAMVDWTLINCNEIPRNKRWMAITSMHYPKRARECQSRTFTKSLSVHSKTAQCYVQWYGGMILTLVLSFHSGKNIYFFGLRRNLLNHPWIITGNK